MFWVCEDIKTLVPSPTVSVQKVMVFNYKEVGLTDL